MQLFNKYIFSIHASIVLFELLPCSVIYFTVGHSVYLLYDGSIVTAKDSMANGI